MINKYRSVLVLFIISVVLTIGPSVVGQSIDLIKDSGQDLTKFKRLASRAQSALKKGDFDKYIALVGGNGILDCLEPAYCANDDSVELYPPAAWTIFPSTESFEWEVETLDDNIIHPSWVKMFGSGLTAKFYFYPHKVAEDSKLGTGLRFICHQVNGSGSRTLSINDISTVRDIPADQILSADTEICSGETAVLNVSDSEAQTLYTLYRDDAPTNTKEPGGGAFTYDVTQAGTYTLLAKNNNTGCEEWMTGSPVVTVNSNPTVGLSSDQGSDTFCEGTNVTFTATGANEYEFYKGTIDPLNIVKTRSTEDFYTANDLVDGDVIWVVGWDASSTQCTDNASVTVTVNPQPTSIISGTTSICDGSSTDLTIDLTGTPPWDITYFDGTSSTTVTANSTPHTISVNPTATTTYTVTALVDANCTADAGDMTGAAVITVNPRPTAVISGSEIICNGETASLTVTLTGTGPWSLTYTDGVTPATVNINASPYTLNVNPTVSSSYNLTALSDANCTALGGDLSGAGDVTVNPRPSSVISGSATLCNGGNTDITITFTGTGPWDFTYTDGTTPVNVTTNSNPYVFNVSPGITTSYSVTALSDANCTALPADMTGTAVVTINPRPTSVISGTTSMCDGSSTTITVNLTGSSPWDFTYSDGSTTTNVTAFTSPYTFTVNPLVNTTYTVTALNDLNCVADPGDMTGAAIITIVPRPTASISGNTTICNGDAGDLTVDLTGTAPWILTYSDGATPTTITVNSSPYTLSVSPSSTTSYNLTGLSDATCTALPGDLSGTGTVNVNPRPTAAITGNNTICNGDNSFISINLAGTPPWDVTYTDGTTPTTVTTNTSPLVLMVSPTTTTTYTVTALNDANCTAIATDMTGAAVVTVNPRPTSFIHGSTSICNGSSTSVSVDLTGTAPWDLTWTDGSTTTNVTVTNSVYSFPVSPGSNTSYTITALSDANCTAIAADMTGSADITIVPRPTANISGSETICNGGTAALTVDLTGSAPWSITYLVNGGSPATVVANSTPYTLNVTPSANSVYTITGLSDAGCTALPGDLTGTGTVNVNSRPTSIISGSTTICNGGTASLNINLTGTGPWDITYNDGLTSTTVTANSSPFILMVNPAVTTTYVVTALDDALCSAIAADRTGSATVTVDPRPTAVLSGNQTICNGDIASLNVILTGSAPWNLTYSDGSTSTNVTINSSPYTLDVSPSVNSLYTLTALTDANCVSDPGDISGSASVTVLPRPTSIISGDATICNGEITPLTFNLTGLGPWDITYSDGSTTTTVTANSTPHVINVSPIITTTYTVTALDDAQCSAIPSDMAGLATVTVNARPTSVMSGTTAICDGETTTISISFTGAGPWDVTYTDGTTPMNVIVNTNPYTFNVTPAADVSYMVSNLSDANCTALAVDMTGSADITVNPVPTANLVSSDADNVICDGDEVIFTASGADTYEFFINNGSVQGPSANDQYITNSLTDGDVVDVIVSYGATGCNDRSAALSYTVNTLPTPGLVANPGTNIIAGTNVTFTASGGVEYQFLVNGLEVQPRGASDTYGPVNTLVDEDIVTVNVYNANNCEATATLTMSVLEGIQLLDVLASALEYCEGDGGVSIYIAIPQTNVTYDLIRTSDDGIVGTITHDGTNAVQWDNLVGSEEYRVEAYYLTVPADRFEMNNRITVVENPLPNAHSILPVGNVTGCGGGSGHEIKLDDSNTDVTYQLLLNGGNIGAPVAGTGSEITFGFQNTFGVYSVLATDDLTLCTRIMNNTFEILPDGTYTAFPVSGTGEFCAGDLGASIVLEGSEVGVEYLVVRDGVDTGDSWTADGTIGTTFGPYLTNGTYTVVVNTPSGCRYPMTGSVDVLQVALPLSHDLLASNNGHFCAGDPVGVNITISGQQLGIEYQLYLEGNPVGAAVIGTVDDMGAPLSFGTHNTAGHYSVIATVPVVGCQSAMNNELDLFEDALPDVFDVTTDGDYCTGSTTFLHLSGSEPNVEYRWEREGDALTGAWLLGNGGILSFEITGTDTYYIVGRRNDGVTSCTSEMNNRIPITEKPYADDSKVLSIKAGTGTDCSNGAIIVVENSENGVVYELEKGGILTGNSVVGNGSDVDFPNAIVDDGGVYTAVANLNGCANTLLNTITITVPGAITQYGVTGSGDICNGDPGQQFGLTYSDAGVNYSLYHVDDPVTLIETKPGEDAPITFNLVNDPGEYYVEASNGTCTVEMLNRVNLVVHPLPIAYQMQGSGTYCAHEPGAWIRLESSEVGVSYMLQRNGLDAMPTAVNGSGAELTFGQFNTAGIYTVVAFNNTTLCTSSMNGSVDVQIMPDIVNQDVSTSPLEYCAADGEIELRLESQQDGVTYQVIDATSTVVLEVIGDNSGTELVLGTLTAGTYTIDGTYNADGCRTSMNGNTPVVITELTSPEDNHVLSVDQNNVCGSVGAVLTLESSEAGRNYRLFADGIDQADDRTGDGNAISWSVTETVSGPVIYEVVALSGGTCDLSMGTQEVTFKSSPSIYNLSAENSDSEYCLGEGGVRMGLDGSDLGIGYQLIDENLTIVDFVSGTGNAFLFNNSHKEGTYTVTGIDFNSGCSEDMIGSVIVVEHPMPLVFNFCCDGNINVEDLVLEGSEVGVTYSLWLDGAPLDPAVDIAGDGNLINFGSRPDAGIYTVVATGTGGCQSVMNGEARLDQAPMIAIDDLFALSKGELIGEYAVAENDILLEGLDVFRSTEEDPVDIYRNLEFEIMDSWTYFNEEGQPQQFETIGEATINSEGKLEYKKLPSFYGRDSVRYIVYNTVYPHRRDTATVFIFVGNVDIDADRSFLIPNAFSPNEDGINDKFVITGIDDKQESKLEVFNRWGTLVYRSKGQNYENDWDGKSGEGVMVSLGENLPNGTYFYVFSVKINQEGEIINREYSGYIELRR
jgi:gliding motility-associated-like protein